MIDLVRQVRLDVSDWSNFSGGPENSSRNPKYCYEWSFIDKTRNLLLLNLWYEEVSFNGDEVTYELNLRETAREIREREKNIPRERRALNFDSALQFAHRTGITVRVILGEGTIKDLDVMGGDGSVVKKRILDSEPWWVSYDEQTGNCRLRRGGTERFEDQFELPGRSNQYQDRRGRTYIRSVEIRVSVLKRSKGKCEWCGQEGFLMNNGSMYIETHHINPLCEGGTDEVTNVIGLCPNHHREAHYGRNTFELRKKMARIVLDKLKDQKA